MMKRLLIYCIVCIFFGCDQLLPSHASVHYWNFDNQFITVDMLDVTVEAGGAEHRFFGDDFTLSNNTYSTDDFSTPTDGEITTFVKIVDGDIIVAEGFLTAKLRGNYSLGIIIAITGGDPDSRCMGCGNAVAFPLNAAYIDSITSEAEYNPITMEYEVMKFDSLYIMLTGNWITNPVIY